MELREWRRALRVGAGAGDGAAVVALTRDFPAECLQEVGTALPRSVIRQAPGAEKAIGACSVALRSRGWAGDDELARELDGVLGAGPGSDLVPLNVALDELGEALQGPAGTDPAIVDLETGQVWTAEAIEYSLDAGLDDMPADPDGQRWVEVWPEPHGIHDMRAFTATVADPALAEMLGRAISGPKSYRPFRDLLERSPAEASRWNACSDDRQLGRPVPGWPPPGTDPTSAARKRSRAAGGDCEGGRPRSGSTAALGRPRSSVQ